MTRLTKLSSLLSLSLLIVIAACTTHSPLIKEEIAKRIAGPAWMVERLIPAEPFALSAFERMHEHNAPANLYIEGDGEAWSTRISQSKNPTPSNPVALHLASRDKADNVVYLARPCQYSGMIDPAEPCDPAHWGSKRFAPEIIESYQLALDEIKARYGITKFNLIGFSGGGAIAAILAAERNDVASLRTVAGNLDHRAHSAHHEVSYMDESLDAPFFADKLVNVPQYHFIGEMDETMPPGVLHSYLQALGDDRCVKHEVIEEASHTEGWVNKWPKLLAKTPSCSAPAKTDFAPWPIEEPIYTPRIGGAKK